MAILLNSVNYFVKLFTKKVLKNVITYFYRIEGRHASDGCESAESRENQNQHRQEGSVSFWCICAIYISLMTDFQQQRHAGNNLSFFMKTRLHLGFALFRFFISEKEKEFRNLKNSIGKRIFRNSFIFFRKRNFSELLYFFGKASFRNFFRNSVSFSEK